MNTKSQMKRPVIVYILSIIFILLPFLNFLISLVFDHPVDWYLPKIWLQALPNVSKFYWCWMALMIVTGLSLLRPRKINWLISIISLIVTLAYNYYAYTQSNNIYVMASSILSTLSIGIVLYFFRFPYLDRRDAWLKVSPRFAVNQDIQINDKSAELINISMTGVLFTFKNKEMVSLEIGHQVQFLLNGIPYQAKIVHIGQHGYGAKFFNMNQEKNTQLKNLFTSLKTYNDGNNANEKVS